MSNQKLNPDRASRRIPREGAGYTVLRLFGVILLVFGILLLLLALIAFVLILVQAAPVLVSIAQNPGSRLAGFVLMGILVWFILPCVGFPLGAICIAAGYLLRRIASRPAQIPTSREDAPTDVVVLGEQQDAG